MNIIFACKTIASSRKNILRDLYNNLITAIKESAHSNLEWIFITCRVYILHVSSLQKKNENLKFDLQFTEQLD